MGKPPRPESLSKEQLERLLRAYPSAVEVEVTDDGTYLEGTLVAGSFAGVQYQPRQALLWAHLRRGLSIHQIPRVVTVWTYAPGETKESLGMYAGTR